MSRFTKLDKHELEELFARSSGPGGQHVNKVSSRVTLRHIPTGLTVTVQDSRSQAQNRELARARLLAALQQRERDAADAARQLREKRRRQSSPRPRGLRERLLNLKHHRTRTKQQRSKVHPD